MQARRVEEKTESSLIKDNTTGDSKFMDGKNNGNNGTVPTKEVAPKTEERSPKENNQTKNQKEVGRGNREWEKRKNQDKTLEQPNNQHQHQKTRIHGKTDKKRKPGNAKSKNQHDECQDELQKWPRETQVQILQRSWRNPRTRRPGLPENKEKQRHYQVRRNI